MSKAKSAKVVLRRKGARIDKNIYGHFAEHLGRCIYDGIFVGKDSAIPHVDGMRLDILEALKRIKIPVLRWPGGCFADEYHWKDGIGPQSERKRMINTHWGGVVEDNSFGTHEFFRLCELLETEPYVCGNVGSGTVQEMSEWVEYMNFGGESPMSALRKRNGREQPFGLTYFGVGNENWGCGGRMRAEHYADLYRNYATYARSYEGRPLYRVAAGPRGSTITGPRCSCAKPRSSWTASDCTTTPASVTRWLSRRWRTAMKSTCATNPAPGAPRRILMTRTGLAS